MYQVLIVDDEAMIRKGLHQIIPWESMGFRAVACAASAAEALAVMRGAPVDVLLTDIQMAGQNGLQLAEAAKELNPELKIVVISGYDRFDYAVTALKMQVDDYILKPLDPEAIQKSFRLLKKKLDEDKARESQRLQHLHTENEYGILRLLGNELLDLQRARQQMGNADYTRIVLVEVPALPQDVWESLGSALNRLAGNYFCISTHILYALFIPSGQCAPLLEALDELFGQYPGVACKIAVSGEFHHPADACRVFMATAESLRQSGDARVVRLDEQAPAVGEDANALKKDLIAHLEGGQSAAVEAELNALFALVRARRLFTGIMLCANMVRDIATYFRMGDYAAFSLLDFSASPPESHEELEARTRADIELVQQRLRNSADGAAHIANRAKQIIEAECHRQDFSLAMIADQLNISYNYLSTVFTREAGLSLKAYLTSVRMERARRLLLERQHKVYAIAEMVGYGNPRYFTDAFRKHFGTSPTEYVQKLGGAGHET